MLTFNIFIHNLPQSDIPTYNISIFIQYTPLLTDANK